MKPKRLMTRCERQFLRRITRREKRWCGSWFNSRREGVQTRMAMALVRRGYLHAAVSKRDFFGGPYPWKEIAVAVDPKNLSHYPIKVPSGIVIKARR